MAFSVQKTKKKISIDHSFLYTRETYRLYFSKFDRKKVKIRENKV